MRKHLLISAVLLTLLAGCGGRAPVEPVATAARATTTVALSPLATPAIATVASTVAQSPIAAPTTEPDSVIQATAVPSVEPALVATATTEAIAGVVPTPTGDVPAADLTCAPGNLTPAQTEGPYYSENPPEDATLYEEGMAGTPITLTGYVFDQDCNSLPGARVDFWQADSGGQYDNQGYTLRGYQLTDDKGRYTVTTVIPGIYPGRTRHIHVKVTAANGPTLVSQLYFPDEPGNATDRIFDPTTLVEIEETAIGQVGFFNFVIDAR